jgi:hypothetical protein
VFREELAVVRCDPLKTPDFVSMPFLVRSRLFPFAIITFNNVDVTFQIFILRLLLIFIDYT